MSFEWDEEKRDANIKKHGVDFIRAAKIFSNPVWNVLMSVRIMEKTV